MIPQQNALMGHNHDVFPRREVMILVLCVAVNSYTLANLFPYVGIMVKELMGLESIDDAGFYAGYIASAFTFGRFVSGYAMGYISDKVGRKPVIVLGLLSIMIFSLAFGVSESFAWAISSRVLLGLTNGIMAASRTSMRELCGQKHVVKGMTYMAGDKSIGLVLGTGIGGALATPAINYPWLFSRTGLFARYPFLLPNIIGAFLAGSALLLVFIWLPETKGLNEIRDDGENERLGTDTTSDGDTNSRDMDGVNLCKFGNFCKLCNSADEEAALLKGDAEQGQARFNECGSVMGLWLIVKIIFLGCTVEMMLIGFDEAVSLWMLSTPVVGGLGWSSREIGEVMMATGVVLGLLQLALFPRAVELVGIVNWHRAGWAVGVLAFVLVPNAKVLSWNTPSLLVIATMGGVLVNCSNSAISIALTVATTNLVAPHHGGKISGVYNTAESLGRFIGPVAYSTTYALSISSSARGYSWMDYHFVFYASAALTALLAGLGWRTLTSNILGGR